MEIAAAKPAGAGDLLTQAALARIRALARLVAPHAPALQRRFDRQLARAGYDVATRKALGAIAPASAALLLARRRGAGRLLEAVEYHGRRLAKLNVAPADAVEALRHAGRLLDPIARGRFQPAREQLHLATVLALNEAYYDVRESEAQAFFGLACAEGAAGRIEDLLARFARVLAKAVRARAAGLTVADGNSVLPRVPQYLTSGDDLRDRRLRKHGRCFWRFPIGVGDDVSGVMEFAFPCPYPWLPREAELLRAAGERCGRAIERAVLIEKLVRLAAEARRIEEEERRRIGRDLHDDTAQSLLLVRLQLEMLERDAPREMRRKIARLRRAVEHSIEDLRRTIAALSPPTLERLGIDAALRQLAERFRKRSAAKLVMRISVRVPIGPEAAEAVYRVAQESLQNVVRHSQATRVNLLLRSADRGTRLSVADDGIGFDSEGASGRPGSFGLAGMRERAARLGGTLKIRSAPGKGTAVVLALPPGSDGTRKNGENSNSADR